MNTDNIRFDEKGLVPAIVQDAVSKEVLTLAYMNEESLQKTIDSGETWFFSRSRNELWHKGATSGNTQSVTGLRYDCDKDALLVLVEPKGPACHTGSYSCFEKGEESKTPDNPFAILSDLERIIAERDTERPEDSYTTYLLTEGVDKILKKVGEEASEVIIAAKNRSHDELKWEAADLIFHLLVLLREQKLPFSEVLKALEERK
ncbi:bifunctional phosphoribosyl-AMP cyclohydrolase/phosphoribosyl-ATP diphosphatase HisIE [Metabacillus sp. KIGAM252]|uniref:Histidine biosynthesis bifunctional protein HisIE n=1 Tax=Metabacillus flavus TaxID=2823519 RepID=A0ABS5LJ39_9BACI|nr:bifunctional phosphoribosyl-AMP cyclohydrolase/phosphoribosyl-ATP diphosphatase HisIE [Metabacillus flavus]MBS2970568.1 bifunctional phosphoribosyl-AMP cyclohydrolase/phosphoribosyl-ATP diphosphatase HisIE [Metabacillus flavus]